MILNTFFSLLFHIYSCRCPYWPYLPKYIQKLTTTSLQVQVTWVCSTFISCLDYCNCFLGKFPYFLLPHTIRFHLSTLGLLQCLKLFFPNLKSSWLYSLLPGLCPSGHFLTEALLILFKITIWHLPPATSIFPTAVITTSDALSVLLLYVHCLLDPTLIPLLIRRLEKKLKRGKLKSDGWLSLSSMALSLEEMGDDDRTEGHAYSSWNL